MILDLLVGVTAWGALIFVVSCTGFRVQTVDSSYRGPQVKEHFMLASRVLMERRIAVWIVWVLLGD